MSKGMENAAPFVNHMIRFCGLNTFEFELLHNNDASDILLRGEHSIEFSPKHEHVTDRLRDVFRTIADGILASELVTDNKRPLLDQLSKLQNEFEMSRKEVEHLRKFKTHFEFEYMLKHGKLPE